MHWRKKWPDLSLRSKCLLLISFPAAATVLMFGVANILAARNAAADERVYRNRETAEAIQRLRAADLETSTNARAYILTAQESFVSRSRASLEAFESSRHKLLNLTADSAVQQQRLLQVAALEQARVERMFGDFARFRSGALSWDQFRGAVSQVEAEWRQKEGLLTAMEQDNTRQLEIFQSRATGLRALQVTLTGVCLVFGLLGGAVMTFLFAHGITTRIAALQRGVAQLAAGSAPEMLAGSDEIGALNQGLRGVAELLGRRAVALENVPHGLAEIDALGRYIWLNKTYAEIAGCSRLDIPADIADIVRPDDRPRVEEAIAEMRVSGRAEIVVRMEQPHRGASEAGMILLPSSQAPDSGFYVFLRDRWAEQRGDAALIRAKDAAEASNRAKTDFLAKISHDIRTPLNAILGSADLLSQTPLSFDQTEYVSMFQRNCRRLVALINDFLDFSRIEAGAVRVERVPFRIRDTVDDAVSTFQEAAARKGLALGVELDPAAPAGALGDPLRIQQVLVNLLSNALKFTSVGRVDVMVKALPAPDAQRQLRFEVCDTGPGIRMEDQEKIFARFVQLPNQSNGQRGTGLGLTICRDLVELMGGEIGVSSREGSGSTFYFSLPLEEMEPVLGNPGAENRSAPLTPIDPIRILVAEDTEDNLLLLQHYLRDEPVTLRIARNGQEALDAVRQGEPFDLILMDIDMPLMDGYTATRQIRAWQQSQRLQRPQNMPTPIVALSADAMQEAVAASLEAGCVAHVAKPMDRETLMKAIRRFGPPKTPQDPPPPRTVTVSEQVLALVPQYLASKEQQIEEARASLVSRDFGPIRRFGHNLKGTGRGYGFPPIEELGREIEQAAAQADAGRIASQLDALHRFVTESAMILNKS